MIFKSISRHAIHNRIEREYRVNANAIAIAIAMCSTYQKSKCASTFAYPWRADHTTLIPTPNHIPKLLCEIKKSGHIISDSPTSPTSSRNFADLTSRWKKSFRMYILDPKQDIWSASNKKKKKGNSFEREIFHPQKIEEKIFSDSIRAIRKNKRIVLSYTRISSARTYIRRKPRRNPDDLEKSDRIMRWLQVGDIECRLEFLMTDFLCRCTMWISASAMECSPHLGVSLDFD